MPTRAGARTVTTASSAYADPAFDAVRAKVYRSSAMLLPNVTNWKSPRPGGR